MCVGDVLGYFVQDTKKLDKIAIWIKKVENMPPQNIRLWHKDYFELVTIESQPPPFLLKSRK